jgi:hypothetical protein
MEGQENQTTNIESGGSAGPVVATIIILAVIVLGALYFWDQRDAVEEEVNVDATVETIETQDESDETSSIEADLEATDVESLDAEFNAS